MGRVARFRVLIAEDSETVKVRLRVALVIMLLSEVKVRGESESLRGGSVPPGRESEIRHHSTCIGGLPLHRIGDPQQVRVRVRE